MLTMITSRPAPTPSATPATPAARAPGPGGPDPGPGELTRRLWTRGLGGDRDFGATRVEGRLPDDLRGTLYRNGPGQVEVFGRRYGHPFEADGAVTALRIDAGGARGASRVIESEGLRAERAAGRMLYGTSAPWTRRLGNAVRGRFKNTANTSVMWWQGRLLALMEAARPTEVDPDTLRAIGETDLAGVVGRAFSAHPHRVASRRTTYNFGVDFGRHTRLRLYALPDAGPARELGALDLDGPPMLHDFIATDHHLIFFLSPVRVSVPRALTGLGGFADLFRWKPRLGTELIVVPIDDVAAAVRWRTDAFFQWHFANAFSRGGEVVVDYVRYPDFASFDDLGAMATATGATPALAAARYHRAVIDPVARTIRSTELLGEACEFPKVHPALEGAPHRHAWLALGDLDAIGRLDCETGAVVAHRLPAHQRASEPIFVPRAGAAAGDERDGHVLALCYDGRRDESFVAVYDGRAPADGPVARVWLGYAVPITFHGTWAPQRP